MEGPLHGAMHQEHNTRGPLLACNLLLSMPATALTLWSAASLFLQEVFVAVPGAWVDSGPPSGC
jgi:hypothetical protein